MSLLTVLADDPERAVDPALVMELAEAHGDRDALARGLASGRLEPTASVVAALLARDAYREHARVALVAVADAGLREDAELAAQVMREVGPEQIADLVEHAAYIDQPTYGEERITLAPVLDLLRAGAADVLTEADADDLPLWVATIGRLGTWVRNDEGRWAYSTSRVVADRALVLHALANPACDGAAVHAVVSAMPRTGEDPAVLAGPLADEAISDRLLGEILADHPGRVPWLVPASVAAGRTGWIPAAAMLEAAEKHPAVARHVADACAALERDALATAVALVEDYAGSFDALVADARAVST